MKILYFYFKLDAYTSQHVAFSSNLNVIYSSENSRGKTTFLRMLLFAMGFKIPATRGLDFEKLEFKLIMTNCDDVEITISRLVCDDFKFVKVRSGEKMSKALYDFHHELVQQSIFGNMDADVLSNILGVFYIDQEKGWTMLNRGTVIGKINFNIETYLLGLGDVDVGSERKEYKKNAEYLKQYQKMSSITAMHQDMQQAAGVVIADSNDDIVRNEFYKVKSEILYTQHELDEIDSICRDNYSIQKIIEKLKLTIITDDNRKIRVTKDNVIGLKEISETLEIRRQLLKAKLKKLKLDFDRVYDEYESMRNPLGCENLLSHLTRELQYISTRQIDIKEAIESLTRRQKELSKIISDAAYNKWAQKMGMVVYDYLLEMHVRKNYNLSDNIILTKKIAELSGAEMSKRVLAFKFAYVLAIRERYGIKLPLIIDSPYAKELDNENLEYAIKILTRDFSEHQIILSSIRHDQFSKYMKISLNGGLFDDKIIEYAMP